MPTYALTSSDDRVHATAASKDELRSYHCPYCGREMSVAGGELTQYRKHFRHRPNESCYDYGTGAETRRHLNGKSDIEFYLLESPWADDVLVESPMEDTVPDVQFNLGGKTIGVELQVSGITANKLRSRTLARSRDGIYTLWLFDSETFRREKESSSANQYVSFKSGEQGYVSLSGATDPAYVHYFDPGGDRLGRLQRYSLFEDANGGWPEYRTGITEIGTYLTPEGVRLAVHPAARPKSTGDENQARLF